ncbi:MAG TPA: hypothetical protein VE462_08185 [Propionibacteriaceae bacterium]|nr:hypothetical protein [Propionibacteriaceae bacterium]
MVDDCGTSERGTPWHEQADELLWVDILGATFHRSAIATDGSLELVTSIAMDRPPSPVETPARVVASSRRSRPDWVY